MMDLQCINKWIYLWIIIETVLPSVAALVPRMPSDEERLLELLFDGYNPSARPVINSSHTVEVKMHFALLQIQELNLKNQMLTTTGLLILEWFDERLRWDESEIPLKDIVLEARSLWRPEFAAINGADGIYGEYGQFRAIINSSGHVHWEPGGVFKTVCNVDITYYPFDEQTCTLVFGAWSYHTTKMNLTNIADEVNLDSFEENGEWDIHNTLAERREFFFDCCVNERFSNVMFSITVRRRYTFYIMNVILPSIMTSVLLLSIFFCTPAQKVQIGVVVLLSFRIFLLNVTDSIPKTSDHIPLLGIYLTCTMAITTLSMVLTVFVLNLHHITDRPVPHWVKTVVLVYVARLMCMYKPPKNKQKMLESSRSSKVTSMVNKDKYRVNQTGLGKAIGSQIGLIAGLNGTVGGGGTGGAINNNKRHNNHSSTADTHSSLSSFENFQGNNYRSQFAFESEQLLPRDTRDDMKRVEEEWAKEWRQLAEILDRLFFWMFLSAIVITTLLLFHPLTKEAFFPTPSKKGSK